MTTILITNDFVLADRSIGHGIEMNRVLEPKMYRGKDNKGVIVVGGGKGFKRKASEWEEAYRSMMRLIHPIKIPGVPPERVNELNETQERLYLSYLKYFVANDDKMFLLTATNNFVFSAGETSAEVLYPGTCHTYGTGGDLAMYLYLLGLPPKEIIDGVSTLDQLTSKEYDIVFRKELNK